MIYDYLQRGVFAGVAAGIGYGLYMAVVGNPLSEYVHDAGHEHGPSHTDHAHGHADHAHDHAHAVSETTTAIVSIGSGMLWAIFLGGLFALALYLFEPALPGSSGIRSYVLAGAGFMTVSATPWLVLPPAAPGAEQLYAIEPRLAIYVGLVAVGAIVSATAIVAYKKTASRHPAVGVAVGAIPIGAVVLVVPQVTPTVVTHPELPGTLVSVYQALAVLSQASIWLVLAATYNWLHRRARESESAIDASEPTAASREPTGASA